MLQWCLDSMYYMWATFNSVFRKAFNSKMNHPYHRQSKNPSTIILPQSNLIQLRLEATVVMQSNGGDDWVMTQLWMFMLGRALNRVWNTQTTQHIIIEFSCAFLVLIWTVSGKRACVCRNSNAINWRVSAKQLDMEIRFLSLYYCKDCAF